MHRFILSQKLEDGLTSGSEFDNESANVLQSKNPLISFSLLGRRISNMALILDGSTSIPLSLTKKPNNFLAVTPKVHFYGFNLSLYSLILSKKFIKLMM